MRRASFEAIRRSLRLMVEMLPYNHGYRQTRPVQHPVG